MKILHINFSGKGGAANAMSRLHSGLLERGVDSQIWCARDAGNAPRTVLIKSRFGRKLDSLKNAIIQKGVLRLFGPVGRSLNVFPSFLVRNINRSEADLIHLHWINGEMVRIEQLRRIQKPVVWTFHDMWPFCGAEHCSWSERFRTGYPPLTGADRPRPDLDRWVFRRKKKAFRSFPFQIVCPGTWLNEMVRESDLYRDRQVATIPNGLDLREYDRLDQSDCRKQLNLPRNKKLVLFGASSASAYHKGFDLFRQAVEVLGGKNEIELVCFGGDFAEKIGGLKVHSAGVVSSSLTLRRLYNAADVVCVPSRLESFGQVALEAMACGVPVVAFNATGLKDIVVHRETGALAEPFSTKALGEEIQWVLSLDPAAHRELGSKARRRVGSFFSHLAIADRYHSLYKGILAQRPSGQFRRSLSHTRT